MTNKAVCAAHGTFDPRCESCPFCIEERTWKRLQQEGGDVSERSETPVERSGTRAAATPLACEVCNGESGGTKLHLAALSTGPMTIRVCDSCLDHRAEPGFALEYVYLDCAHGDLKNVAPWVFDLHTWHDRCYMNFAEYIRELKK